MRYILFLSAVVLITSHVEAQDSWAAYHASVPVSQYQGKKFRLKSFVRAEVTEKDASARLWVRITNTDGTRGFYDGQEKDPITSSEWKQYSIEGTVNEKAGNMAIGALVMNNGKYYFDDMELQVEAGKGKWLSIYKEDFEDKAFDLKPGIEDGKSGMSPKFTATITDQVKKNGKAAWVISGSGIINFGNNPTAGKFADVNGVRIYYEVYGEGAPLVVLHGNGGSIANAASHYPDLIPKYKVIAIDSRGQGNSTDSNEPLTYEQMASDVNAILEQLRIDSTFIWGQSDGAILGILLAKDFPRKVKRVVAYGSNMQPDSSAVFEWAIDFLDRSRATTADKKAAKLLQLMTDHPNVPMEQLKNIKAPVLLMAGDRDVIRPEHTVRMFQHIPNSQLCILPGSTHGGAWEKKELFLQIMNDFFQKPFTKPDTRSWFE